MYILPKEGLRVSARPVIQRHNIPLAGFCTSGVAVKLSEPKRKLKLTPEPVNKLIKQLKSVRHFVALNSLHKLSPPQSDSVARA